MSDALSWLEVPYALAQMLIGAVAQILELSLWNENGILEFWLG